MPLSAGKAPSSAVLDTNVVLDWLLFADPGVTALAAAVQTGTVCWLSCQRMRDELEHTLRRPELSRWRPDGHQLLNRFDGLARMLPTPPATTGLRCTDPQDQVFIDLALHTRATWLISHDRAVLKLRSRAAKSGLKILRPADWSPNPAPQ